MPKVYIIPDSSPNAFATGRNPQHAAVAATEGIMQALAPHELEGVMPTSSPTSSIATS